jgi:hypothetical protein
LRCLFDDSLLSLLPLMSPVILHSAVTAVFNAAAAATAAAAAAAAATAATAVVLLLN